MNELKSNRLRWILRTLIVWAIEVIALVIMAHLLPGLVVETWGTAIIAIAVVGILNAILWPTLIGLTLTINVLTFGLFTLVLNGFTIWLAALIVPGFIVDNFATTIFMALGIAAINTFLSSLLSIDDDASYYRSVIRRIAKRQGLQDKTDIPGVLFLEIDGLSEPILRRALDQGFMPTLNRWLRTGSHRLVRWECDLSSQTGASQAGILHGNNRNMPAFRWYEKDTNRILISNRPKDTPEIENRLSDGQGLLVNGGASRGNMFSGDAPNTLFTFSTLTDRSRFRTENLYYYFANPYNVTRAIILFIWDIFLELQATRRQRRRDIYPRMHRGGIYPLLRATTTVILRELTVYTLISDMFQGLPVIYATFVGYDEVAHHSGVARPDALEVLYKLDQQFARLESAAKLAPRPYHFVSLSDHGQSQGATFKQRYHITLEDLVRQLTRQLNVEGLENADESWANISAVLTDAMQDQKRLTARAVRTAAKRHTYDGAVVLGPDKQHYKTNGEALTGKSAEVIVLASGNLGLIYLTNWKERMSHEQINEAFPALIPGLTHHPGIGFVMVRSEKHGPLAIGANGLYYLADERVEGENPLANFGPNAARHLRRTDSFTNAPDILVNSLYDPEADEGAAFEELIGFHGGLGGNQSKPFLIFPADWELARGEIIGAAQLYSQLKSWLNQVQARSNDGKLATEKSVKQISS